MKLYDISVQIRNNMWSYKPQWKNNIQLFESTVKGDASTVYNLNLFSHTGTYIETSSHKLVSEIFLNHLPLESFYRNVKVIVVKNEPIITLNQIESEIKRSGLNINKGEALIIASGYGINHDRDDYLTSSPSFEPELINWLIERQIGLLGVDTPIIENLNKPFQPVIKLFNANNQLLLLAPLKIDVEQIRTGEYTLSCFPIEVENTTGMLCRAVLIDQNGK